MKVEIILALALMNLSIGYRQPRSTILTDESKRVFELFDFSNFDKQEALNYIDRQRYENQIRGKRSQSKYRRELNNQQVKDPPDKGQVTPNKPKVTYKSESIKMQDLMKEIKNGQDFPGSQVCYQKYQGVPKTSVEKYNVRNKRGHRNKKKHKTKSVRYNGNDATFSEDEGNFENDGQYQKIKKKKKKRHYWDHWTEWSPCSVTCGKGRKIRWRKCVADNCTTGEMEMGEKTCQLPACNLLSKLLGLK